MEMLIPISVAYFLSRPAQDPSRPLLGFSLLFPIASLLLCGSRGAWISLLVEALILGWIFIRYSPASRGKSLATLSLLGILAAVSVSWWLDAGGVSKRLASVVPLSQTQEAGLGDRLLRAQDSLRMFRAHPYLGTGLGSFEVAFPPYQSSASDSLWDHAHNDYAEALAETGLIGGLLVIWALILFFRLAFRNLGERLRPFDRLRAVRLPIRQLTDSASLSEVEGSEVEPHRAGWIALGAATGCCGLLVHSFVDFNLHIPANAAWFAVCAAIATHAGESLEPGGTARPRRVFQSVG
jgi:O-antigen ligase